VTAVEPAGRFEWERIVRRARLPEPLMCTALLLATYADPDGSRVRPGSDVLCAVTGRGERTVRRRVTWLLHNGLIAVVHRGGGRGRRTTVYRLTVPADLLERFELLPPSERPPLSPATQVTGELPLSPVDEPVDNSVSPANRVTGETNGHAVFHRPPDDTSGDFHRPSRALSPATLHGRLPPK
jgi:hypothetical protein